MFFMMAICGIGFISKFNCTRFANDIGTPVNWSHAIIIRQSKMSHQTISKYQSQTYDFQIQKKIMECFVWHEARFDATQKLFGFVEVWERYVDW